MKRTFTPRSWLLAGLALSACAAPSSAKGGLVELPIAQDQLDRVQTGRRFALVIGVNHFDDPGWRDLRFAAKDADDMASVLGDPNRGGFSVIRHNSAESTSRAAILAAFDDLQALDNRPDDVVVVYLSMHGTLGRGPSGQMERYLVARDTRMSAVPETGISLDALQARLESFASRRKVLILATCHSGSGKSLLPPSVLAELQGTKGGFFSRPLEDASRASIVLAACDWGETAREDEGLGNDIYTHFLVEALLLPADRNGDGAVTATEAHDYARRRTFEFTHGQQRPSAQMVEVGADPVILAGAVMRAGQPELYGYQSSLDGALLRVDTDEPLDLPGGRTLAAGLHRVQLTKGGVELFQGDVDVSAGERVDVAELITSSRQRFQVEVAGGYEGFLDQTQSSALTGPTTAAQLSVTFPDLIAKHLAARTTFSMGWGARTQDLSPGAPPEPFRYLDMELGIGVPYQRRIGPFEVEAGPQLTGVYIDRSFSQSIYSSPQRFLTLSPGLEVGAGYALDDHWMVVIRGSGSAEVISVNGSSQTAGFGSVWMGVGFGI